MLSPFALNEIRDVRVKTSKSDVPRAEQGKIFDTLIWPKSGLSQA